MIEECLPSAGLVGDTELSLLDSRAILFRANKALPVFCVTNNCTNCVAEKNNLKLKNSTVLSCYLPLLPG